MNPAGSAGPSSLLRIGRVVRATGLKGELRVQLFRPRRETLARPEANDRVVVGDGPPRRVLGLRRVSPSELVLRLEGVGDRSAAEALAGAFVQVDPAALPRALTDAADRALGLPVQAAGSGAPLGTVVGLEDNGAQALLVIRGEAGEHLVPFVSPLCAVLADGRGVEVTVIPGLFEVEGGP